MGWKDDLIPARREKSEAGRQSICSQSKKQGGSVFRSGSGGAKLI